jgi:hypothetical protein
MSRDIDYFQIGAHIGNTDNDPIFSVLTENKSLILIEPNPYAFDDLRKNYEEKTKTNSIQFENIAVSNKDGFLSLYVPSRINDFTKYPSWTTQIASTNENHLLEHLPDLIIDRISIPCYRLNTLIAKMDIRSIDYLCIDTEGHDYEILSDLDLQILKPKNIVFENKHMDGIFTKSSRYQSLIEHFVKNGYEIIYEDAEDTHIRLRA